MFIRAVKKQRSKSAKTFYQFTLAQTVRHGQKVKQRSILYLGSDERLHDKNNREIVLILLKSLIHKQPGLYPQHAPAELEKLARSYYEKYKLRYENAQHKDDHLIPPLPEKADYHQVDVKHLEVADVKSFGAEHLCKQVLDKLDLAGILKNTGLSKADSQMALMAIAARAIFTSSEHKTAQYINLSSELAACFGVEGTVNHKQLYSMADKLYQKRSAIDEKLYAEITNMFNLDDKLVIYDMSNTYFETSKRESDLAKHGRSKEKRSDCPLVVFTGVINAEGFIRHSRIYEGNKPDAHTLSDMLADLEKHSPGTAKKTVVLDAGIADENNLEMLRKKGHNYVCVSRKRMKDYPTGKTITQLTDRGHNKVQLRVFKPEAMPDTWMYVESDAKRRKETSMDSKLTAFFEQDMEAARQALHKKGGTKKVEKVWQRIGRLKEKHKRISGRFTVEVQHKDDLATNISWQHKPSPVQDAKQKGVYFIRTNYTNPDEKELWNIYNTIREVESTFRCLKSDLQLRPVHHQTDHCVASHIYLAMLAYQLVNTIRYMLKQHGLHHNWQNVLRIMNTQTIQTLELPTDKKMIHLRKPSKPIKEVQEIYSATNCKDTQKGVKKYVVYH